MFLRSSCVAVPVLLALAQIVSAQCVSLTAGTTYTQNFDTLASSGTSNTAVPAGWAFSESGTAANTTYAAGTGSDNQGNTYSFGASGSTERALGGLLSGSLTPAFGACFTNNTGAALSSVTIQYTGEHWRLGANTGRSDRIDFQYSTDATSLTTGAWSDADTLDFSSVVTTGTVGALNGNSNHTTLGPVVLTVSVNSGATFWIRWTDYNPSGSDDGLAVDDFSLTPGGGGGDTPPSGIGAATPASVFPGDSTLLTVAVTQGTPASAISSVIADLTTIGGAASQALYDDGTHGDVTSGDATYSFAAAPSLTGVKSLPVTITDAAARTGSASIALTVVNGSVVGTIGAVQGAGVASPYAGQTVRVSGVVTAVKYNGFFIQDAGDGNPSTSDGIFVFTNTAPPATAVVGNLVQVTGAISEYVPSADANSPPLTEITGPAVSVISSGNLLPSPVNLTAADTPAGAPLDVLERYEGMRVHVDALTVVGPSAASQTDAQEPTGTYVATGVFYGVIPGVARPLREAGIQLPDPLIAGAPANPPRWDANNERLRVDSDAINGTTILNVASGATIQNLTGPLDYAYRTYTILPETTPAVTGMPSVTPVRAAQAAEVKVASFNMLRMFDTVNDPAVPYDVALNAAWYAKRLIKASRVVRTVLGYPDVLAVQEVENLATLQAIASQINSDAATAGDPIPNYVAYLEEGNDPGGIDVGFLVKTPRISGVTIQQVGKSETFINPDNGSTETLFDRPLLILTGTASLPAGASEPFTVIAVHLRSLGDVDAAGSRVRAKRRAGAEYFANLIQARQTANPSELILSIGDFNAFEVNDGYVDVMGTILGTPAAADTVYLASSDLVNPNQEDLLFRLPAAERYSTVYDGNGETLDHAVITSSLGNRVTGFAYARNNADYPGVWAMDETRPERASDHDPAVVYLNLAPSSNVTSQFTISVGGVLYSPATKQYSGTVRITNNGPLTYGPVHLIFTGLTSGVTLANKTGDWGSDSYITIPGTLNGVAPGQTLAIPMRFNNPARVRFGFTPRLQAGPLN